MKPETEAVLRSRTPEQMAEIMALMLECMTPELVAECFAQDDSTEFTSWGDRAFEAILRKADKEASIEAVRILADELEPEDFVEGLEDENSFSPSGARVFEEMSKHGDNIADDKIADELHEAICEGRQQDAIDLLGELTGGDFRRLDAQWNLFPARGKTASSLLVDW